MNTRTKRNSGTSTIEYLIIAVVLAVIALSIKPTISMTARRFDAKVAAALGGGSEGLGIRPTRIQGAPNNPGNQPPRPTPPPDTR